MSAAEGPRDAIRIERHLPVPPERVYQAWGDPESLAVWMCPGDMPGASCEVDFRVGGRFRIAMHGENGDFVQTGEYRELEVGKRIVMTWVSDWIAPEHAATLVTVTLEPVDGGGTLLRLVHDELPAGDAYDGHPEGWSTIFEKLAGHLA